jgi:hypothetical protein
VAGLASEHGKLIYSTISEKLINPTISYFPLSKFITKELVSATNDIPTERAMQRIVIASVYFPPEGRNPPTKILVELVDHLKSHNIQIIIGCNVSAHHKVWGS